MIPYLHVTTRIPDKRHDGMLKEKGFTGFPTLAFMDSDGKVLLKQGAREVSAFAESKAKVDKFLALVAKAADGDEADKKALFFARLDLDQCDFAEAKTQLSAFKLKDAERRKVQEYLLGKAAPLGAEKAKAELASLDLPADLRKQADSVLVDIEIADIAKKAYATARETGQRPDLSETFYAMYKQGKLPSDTPQPNLGYWSAVMTAADKAGDADGFRDGWKRMKARLEASLQRANGPAKGRLQEMLEKNDKRLAELEAAKAEKGDG